MRLCQYQPCSVSFEPKTHNQKYCCDECCRLATNKRIMERYYERKERRQGNKRVCENEGCRTELSRYNDRGVCSLCVAKKNEISRKALIGVFGVDSSVA